MLVAADDAGHELFSRRQLHRLPQPPFMLVAGIRHLDAIGAGLHPQHQIDDVLERQVGDVRRVKAAPADVIADAVLRQAGDGVVERVDAHRGPFAILRQLGGGKRHVVHVGQKRVVDLHHQPGIDYRLVFLAQRLGELEQELLVVLVIFVFVAGHRACRRHDRQKGIGHRGAPQRRFEDGDVFLQRRLAAVADRTDANDGAALRQLLGGEIFSVKIGKQLLIAPRAARRLDRALLDTAEAVEHVERPAAEFAELAVADDVDAGLALAPDHRGDAVGEAAIEGGLIDFDAVVDRLDVVRKPGRANEAAHMRGQDAIAACRHDVNLSRCFADEIFFMHSA